MVLVKHIRWWQIALLVTVVSASFALLAWLQRTSFSSQDVHVIMEGERSIESGKEVSLRVGVENATAIALRSIQLTVDLPSWLVTQEGKRFAVFRWDELGGGLKVMDDLIVVGQGEQEEGTIRARIEYSPEGFAGRFVVADEFSVTSRALNITSIFDLPDNVVPGQEIEGSLHIVSSEEISFDPLWLELVAPEDFVLSEAHPLLDDNNRWRVEDFVTEKDYKFQFRGIIQGLAGEEKTFKVLAGYMRDGQFTSLAQTQSTLYIGETPLSVEQEIKGAEGEVVVPGQELDISVQYENAGDIPIYDVTVDVFLSGSSFDWESFTSGEGLLDRRTSTVTWNKTVVPALDMLDAGESGEVTFHIALRDGLEPSNARDKNFTISSRARIHSPQRSLAFGGASFEDQDVVVLKVASRLSLTARAFRELGAFANYGPIPPRVGEGTSYSVVWEVENTTNDASAVQVEGILPSYVRWVGVTDPPDARLSYNQDAHTVVWQIGAVSLGTGAIFPSKQASFQIELTPAPEHRGNAIAVVEEAKVSGKDTFTESFLEDITQSIDTILPDDPSVSSEQGVVQ